MTEDSSEDLLDVRATRQMLTEWREESLRRVRTEMSAFLAENGRPELFDVVVARATVVIDGLVEKQLVGIIADFLRRELSPNARDLPHDPAALH